MHFCNKDFIIYRPCQDAKLAWRGCSALLKPVACRFSWIREHLTTFPKRRRGAGACAPVSRTEIAWSPLLKRF